MQRYVQQRIFGRKSVNCSAFHFLKLTNNYNEPKTKQNRICGEEFEVGGRFKIDLVSFRLSWSCRKSSLVTLVETLVQGFLSYFKNLAVRKKIRLRLIFTTSVYLEIN